MEDEIEETLRQLRRSATLIQDAYEGLSMLHNRVSEATTSMRTQSGVSSPHVFSTQIRHITEVPTSGSDNRSSMDPGHDVIIVSSSDQDDTSALATPTNATSPALPLPTTTSTSPRRARQADTTLAALRSELLATTQSVRERATEFDELRRAIFQYSQERRDVISEGTLSRSPPNLREDPPFPPALSSYLRQLDDAPSNSPGAFRAVAEVAPPRESGILAGPVSAPSRRMLLDYSLRQRAAGESATSLGMRVAARSNVNNASTNTIAPVSVLTTNATIATTPLSPPSISRPPIPSGITSRVTRLAQEIQQDIARITQQSESLVAWIHDYSARLNAAASVRASNSSSSSDPSTPASSTAVATTTVSRPRAPADPFPTTAESVFAPSAPSSSSRALGTSRVGVSLRPVRSSESGTDETADPDQQPVPIPARPRRISEGAVRARYLRQNVPSSWSATSPSASGQREDRGPWTSSARTREGPPSFISRSVTVAPPSVPTTTTDAAANLVDDPELTDATRRLRTVLARASGRYERRSLDLEMDEEDYTESRNYRVRRRVNADGDEEVVRVPMRSESPSTPTRDDMREDTTDEAWLQALTRLETMSRQTAARTGASSRDLWELPRMTRGGTQAGTALGAGSSGSPSPIPAVVNSRRSTRPWWPRLNAQGEDTSTEEESGYERDRAAMRARALSLISSPARTLGGASLPPPPPTTRPLSFVPTTQGTPGSLWNDSGVRVRLRAAVAHLNEDMRRSLDVDTEPFVVRSPSPPLERSRRDRRGHGQHGELEQPMWGSPTPFQPSTLPLPLVEDVSSLEARSRVFAGAKKLTRMPRQEGVAQVGR